MSTDSFTTTHLDILSYVKSGINNVTAISEKLSISRSTIKRRVDDLLDHKLVEKNIAGNTRVYTLTQQGTIFLKQGLSKKPTDGEVLKAHKVQWSVDIMRKPWKLHDQLEKNSFTVSEHNTWQKYTTKDFAEGVTIVFNPNKVHFYIHEFFLDSPMEYYPVAQEKLLRVCNDLQDKFPGLKLGEPKRLFTVHSQHVVKQGGPVAQKFEEEAIRTGVPKVYHGKRFTVDHSQGDWEEETVDPKTAPADMHDLGYFFDEWLENPFFPKDFHTKQRTAERNEQSVAKAQSDIQDLHKSSVSAHKRISSLETRSKRRTEKLLSTVAELQQGQDAFAERYENDQEALSKVMEGVLRSHMNMELKSAERHGMTMEQLETFGVAMREHVTLVKALQASAAAVTHKADQNTKNFELQSEAIDKQSEMIGQLIDVVKELKKPWYRKVFEFLFKHP